MRLPSGGTRIDRARPLRFTFDGADLEGYAGDTLASALLANDVHVVARSIHHGRPRGIVAAGFDEPNAFLQVDGDPMVQATRVPLRDGMVAESLAGRGRLTLAPDDRRYDRMHAHCDVIVVGGGQAGTAAADEAARTGARVVLVCAGPAPEIEPQEELRVLAHTTAVGRHDHGLVTLDERGTRLWHVRARRIVLATGAYERTLAFKGNDLPGVMLAGAVERYLDRYGVRAGERPLVLTATASGRRVAERMGGHVIDATRIGTFEAHGEERVEAVTADGRTIACDLLAVSGGWEPATQLARQPASGEVELVGAAAPGSNGHTGWDDVFALPAPDGSWDRHYVDLQRDATVADIRRAVGAGMRSPEHVKRRTTIGTAADQGRTSGPLARGVLAGLLGVPAGDLGPTTARAPFAPVSFALYAGRDRGALHDPVRTTPMHPWHEAHDAVFEDVGQWKRPFCFPRDGEDEEAAVLRECT